MSKIFPTTGCSVLAPTTKWMTWLSAVTLNQSDSETVRQMGVLLIHQWIIYYSQVKYFDYSDHRNNTYKSNTKHSCPN